MTFGQGFGDPAKGTSSIMADDPRVARLRRAQLLGRTAAALLRPPDPQSAQPKPEPEPEPEPKFSPRCAPHTHTPARAGLYWCGLGMPGVPPLPTLFAPPRRELDPVFAFLPKVDGQALREAGNATLRLGRQLEAERGAVERQVLRVRESRAPEPALLRSVRALRGEVSRRLAGAAPEYVTRVLSDCGALAGADGCCGGVFVAQPLSRV
eukprot:COSAG01_NODE_2951_length_6804_cov_32.584489_7_plen_209_part_00